MGYFRVLNQHGIASDALLKDTAEGGELAAGIDWSGPENLDIAHGKMEEKGQPSKCLIEHPLFLHSYFSIHIGPILIVPFGIGDSV